MPNEYSYQSDAYWSSDRSPYGSGVAYAPPGSGPKHSLVRSALPDRLTAHPASRLQFGDGPASEEPHGMRLVRLQDACRLIHLRPMGGIDQQDRVTLAERL